MAKSQSLRSGRVRWFGVIALTTIVAAVAYVVGVDPWLYRRHQRAQLNGVMKDFRASLVAHEDCALGRLLPPDDPLNAVYAAYFSGTLTNRSCSEALEGRLAAVRTRLAGIDDWRAERLAKSLPASRSSTEPRSARVLAYALGDACERFLELRRSYDTAASSLGLSTLQVNPESMESPGCAWSLDSLEDYRVEAPAAHGRTVHARAWIENNTLYRIVATEAPDYENHDAAARARAVTAQRKVADGPWEVRELPGAVEAGWDGDVLWGVGVGKGESTERILIAGATGGVMAGTTLPAGPRLTRPISLAEARALGRLPARPRATGDTRAFAAYGWDFALIGVRVADEGRGPASLSDIAPPDLQRNRWLRIADSGAFIVLWSRLSNRGITFISQSTPVVGDPARTEVDIGPRKIADLVACAAGAHSWVLAGGEVMLHSANDGATWSRLGQPAGALSQPLLEAMVACEPNAAFVFGIASDDSVRWSRCTPAGCTDPVAFAVSRPGEWVTAEISFDLPSVSLTEGGGTLLLPYGDGRFDHAALFRFDPQVGKPTFERAYEGWTARDEPFWLIDGRYFSTTTASGYSFPF